MSGDDFNITSELFSIKIHKHRRERFQEFLKKRFCVENWEVWVLVSDVIELIKNHALDVVKPRNTLLFEIFNRYVHEGSESPMNVSMELKTVLQQMISGLRVDPNGKFDVRVVLELQKEAEVLLLTDVKTFCNEVPPDSEESGLTTDATLEGVLMVGAKPREKMQLDVEGSGGGGGPAAKKEGSTKRRNVFSTIFSGKDAFAESKQRVVLEESGSLLIYQSNNPTIVQHALHMSAITLEFSDRGRSGSSSSISAAATTSPATSSLRKSVKADPKALAKQELTLEFAAAGNDFLFRFKSEEERETWKVAVSLKSEHWRQIKIRRKSHRALILQAEIGAEAAGGVNSFVDNFQGALRRSAGSVAPTSKTVSAQTVSDGIPMPTLQWAATSSKLERKGAATKIGQSRRKSVQFSPAGNAPASSVAPVRPPAVSAGAGRDALMSSAPVSAISSRLKSSVEHEHRQSLSFAESFEDESGSSSSEEVASPGVAKTDPHYRAITFDDDATGLADASMYDAPNDDDPLSPLAQMYGRGQAPEVAAAARPSAISNLQAKYAKVNRLSSTSVPPPAAPESGPSGDSYASGATLYAAGGPAAAAEKSPAPAPKFQLGVSDDPALGSYGQLPVGTVSAPVASAAPQEFVSPRMVEMSDSGSDLEEPDAAGGGGGEEQFVHRDNLYDFNGIFQQKLQELKNLRFQESAVAPAKLEAVYTAIIRLGEDFVKTALTYGKIIINEKYLPLKYKTIKPSADMGGVLGGEKYVVHKMLFKFAIDSKGVFRGRDDASAKVAGHELKGLKAYFSVADPDLHFPLMALIDYKGFRLIAVSMLPLKSGSLIYGSEDAGVTVHAKDPKLNELIETASKRLNLKRHGCGKNNVTVYSPVDLEGHIGQDGRFYLLDFSRVFPPVTPSREVVGGHLFQYFRSEFVYNFPLFPLCSDAYSRFVLGQPDEKEHQQEIDAATRDLTGITLSNFARELVAMLEEEVRAVGTLKNFRLTEEMHRIGVNMRYLGLLVSRLGKFKYCKFLIAHMCARLIKIQIREKLRARMAALKLAVDEPYRVCVTDYLNLVFGDSAASTQHWNTEIVAMLDSRFSLRPRNWNQFPRNLKEYIWSGLEMKKGAPLEDLRVYLFEQVRIMSGITFSATLESLIAGANNDFWSQKRFCDDTDVVELGAKVKHLDVMSKARGRVFSLRAEEKQRQGFLQSAKQLFLSALESFETALSGSPLDPDLLRNCAITKLRVILIDQRLVSPSAAPALVADHPAVVRVGRYFVRALQADPEDPFSHMSYAKYLVLCSSHEKAEDHFLQSLTLEPNQEKGLLAYAEFLETIRRQTMDAAIFRSRAQHVRQFLINQGKSVMPAPALIMSHSNLPTDKTVKG